MYIINIFMYKITIKIGVKYGAIFSLSAQYSNAKIQDAKKAINQEMPIQKDSLF